MISIVIVVAVCVALLIVGGLVLRRDHRRRMRLRAPDHYETVAFAPPTADELRDYRIRSEQERGRHYVDETAELRAVRPVPRHGGDA